MMPKPAVYSLKRRKVHPVSLWVCHVCDPLCNILTDMGRQFLNGVVGVVAVVLSTIGELELAGL